MTRERRTHVIKVRMSSEEKERLSALAAAAEVTLSEFLRDSAGRAQVVNRADWRRRTFLLSNLCNNLNQISRWANTFKSAAEAQQVVVGLLRLERVVREAFALAQEENHP